MFPCGLPGEYAHAGYLQPLQGSHSETRQVKMFLNLDVPNSSFGFTTDQRLLNETLVS